MFKGMFATADDGAYGPQGLADRAAIADLLTTFSVAIDSCDWPRYRSVFTDEIDLDYSSWRAGSIGRWAADDWVARAAQLFPGFTATRHALTKVLVTLDPDDPDRARVRADVSADHVIVDAAGVAAVFTLDGWYDDRCVRTARRVADRGQAARRAVDQRRRDGDGHRPGTGAHRPAGACVMDLQLAGKHAIVTGGTRGIGRAGHRAPARRGHERELLRA